MTKHSLALLVSTVFISMSVMSQDNATIKSLSIFKNGQSFIVKEASVDAVEGVYKISKLPNALFGTYWFNGISTPINSVTSKMENFVDKKERKANSFLELLYANKGMEITVNTNDNQIYKGIVEDFDLPEEINSKIALQQLELTNEYEGLYGFDRIFSSASPVILLKMSGKWISIEPSTIRSIEFSQKPNRTTTANISVQKPIVTVHFDRAGKQDFQYMYLQSGLSWTPVYKMRLLSETEAELNLQAEVINTIEDITHTNVDFVVGVPNFSQATSLATLLNYSDKGTVSYPSAGYANQYRKMEKMTMLADASITPAPVVSTSENEDLYFYSVKDMNLEKGAHAQFSLFSQKVKINHFYKCDLPVSPFSNYQLNAESQDDSETTDDETANNANTALNVNHYIEVYNTGNMPFTSGPVLMLQGKDETVLAQDILPFTAKGSHASVFVTSSPDIIVTENEKIASVKRASRKIGSISYALLTIKGTISIQNSKSKPTTLKLNKPLTGKMLSASVKYSTNVNTKINYTRIGNASQTVSFYDTLGPAEKKVIDYNYQIYVRE